MNANGQTNTSVVGFGTCLATLLMWVLGFYQPALMAEAPAGAEAAIAGVIIFLLARFMPAGSTFRNPTGKAP